MILQCNHSTFLVSLKLYRFLFLYSFDVTDVNDNVPFFTSSIYEASVTEGAGIGTFVVQVSAIDLDLGQNGEVSNWVLHLP